jgi:hypothetical protein
MFGIISFMHKKFIHFTNKHWSEFFFTLFILKVLVVPLSARELLRNTVLSSPQERAVLWQINTAGTMVIQLFFLSYFTWILGKWSTQ